MPKWFDKLTQRFGDDPHAHSEAKLTQRLGDDPRAHPEATEYQNPQYQQATKTQPQVPLRDPHDGPVIPKVAGEPQVLGIVSDPRFNRDSGNSVRVNDRELWTWRDTCHWPGERLFFTSSTAAWSDFTGDGKPKIHDGTLRLYGEPYDHSPYFPIPSNKCNVHSGAFDDGSRQVIWPDTRPLVVEAHNGDAKIYTWIKQARIQGLTDLDPAPKTALYRADYRHGNRECARDPPRPRLVHDNHWPEGGTAYGTYGYVVHDGHAYLYGRLKGGKGIAIARVSLEDIENPFAYSFYTSASGWTKQNPGMDNSDAAIPNAGTGGQGTFYWSNHFRSFVWIGGSSMNLGADFYVATAPAPEGPWTKPAPLYKGEGGSGQLPAYTCQAHPGLSESEGSGRDIYLTYTKVDASPGGDLYTTPLIRVVWE